MRLLSLLLCLLPLAASVSGEQQSMSYTTLMKRMRNEPNLFGTQESAAAVGQQLGALFNDRFACINSTLPQLRHDDRSGQAVAHAAAASLAAMHGTVMSALVTAVEVARGAGPSGERMASLPSCNIVNGSEWSGAFADAVDGSQACMRPSLSSMLLEPVSAVPNALAAVADAMPALAAAAAPYAKELRAATDNAAATWPARRSAWLGATVDCSADALCSEGAPSVQLFQSAGCSGSERTLSGSHPLCFGWQNYANCNNGDSCMNDNVASLRLAPLASVTLRSHCDATSDVLHTVSNPSAAEQCIDLPEAVARSVSFVDVSSLSQLEQSGVSRVDMDAWRTSVLRLSQSRQAASLVAWSGANCTGLQLQAAYDGSFCRPWQHSSAHAASAVRSLSMPRGSTVLLSTTCDGVGGRVVATLSNANSQQTRCMNVASDVTPVAKRATLLRPPGAALPAGGLQLFQQAGCPPSGAVLSVTAAHLAATSAAAVLPLALFHSSPFSAAADVRSVLVSAGITAVLASGRMNVTQVASGRGGQRCIDVHADLRAAGVAQLWTVSANRPIVRTFPSPASGCLGANAIDRLLPARAVADALAFIQLPAGLAVSLRDATGAVVATADNSAAVDSACLPLAGSGSHAGRDLQLVLAQQTSGAVTVFDGAACSGDWQALLPPARLTLPAATSLLLPPAAALRVVPVAGLATQVVENAAGSSPRCVQLSVRPALRSPAARLVPLSESDRRLLVHVYATSNCSDEGAAAVLPTQLQPLLPGGSSNSSSSSSSGSMRAVLVPPGMSVVSLDDAGAVAQAADNSASTAAACMPLTLHAQLALGVTAGRTLTLFADGSCRGSSWQVLLNGTAAAPLRRTPASARLAASQAVVIVPPSGRGRLLQSSGSEERCVGFARSDTLHGSVVRAADLTARVFTSPSASCDDGGSRTVELPATVNGTSVHLPMPVPYELRSDSQELIAVVEGGAGSCFALPADTPRVTVAIAAAGRLGTAVRVHAEQDCQGGPLASGQLPLQLVSGAAVWLPPAQAAALFVTGSDGSTARVQLLDNSMAVDGRCFVLWGRQAEEGATWFIDEATLPQPLPRFYKDGDCSQSNGALVAALPANLLQANVRDEDGSSYAGAVSSVLVPPGKALLAMGDQAVVRTIDNRQSAEARCFRIAAADASRINAFRWAAASYAMRAGSASNVWNRVTAYHQHGCSGLSRTGTARLSLSIGGSSAAFVPYSVLLAARQVVRASTVAHSTVVVLDNSASMTARCVDLSDRTARRSHRLTTMAPHRLIRVFAGDGCTGSAFSAELPTGRRTADDGTAVIVVRSIRVAAGMTVALLDSRRATLQQLDNSDAAISRCMPVDARAQAALSFMELVELEHLAYLFRLPGCAGPAAGLLLPSAQLPSWPDGSGSAIGTVTSVWLPAGMGAHVLDGTGRILQLLDNSHGDDCFDIDASRVPSVAALAVAPDFTRSVSLYADATCAGTPATVMQITNDVRSPNFFSFGSVKVPAGVDLSVIRAEGEVVYSRASWASAGCFSIHGSSLAWPIARLGDHSNFDGLLARAYSQPGCTGQATAVSSSTLAELRLTFEVRSMWLRLGQRLAVLGSRGQVLQILDNSAGFAGLAAAHRCINLTPLAAQRATSLRSAVARFTSVIRKAAIAGCLAGRPVAIGGLLASDDRFLHLPGGVALALLVNGRGSRVLAVLDASGSYDPRCSALGPRLSIASFHTRAPGPPDWLASRVVQGSSSGECNGGLPLLPLQVPVFDQLPGLVRLPPGLALLVLGSAHEQVIAVMDNRNQPWTSCFTLSPAASALALPLSAAGVIQLFSRSHCRGAVAAAALPAAVAGNWQSLWLPDGVQVTVVSASGRDILQQASASGCVDLQLPAELRDGARLQFAAGSRGTVSLFSSSAACSGQANRTAALPLSTSATLASLLVPAGAAVRIQQRQLLLDNRASSLPRCFALASPAGSLLTALPVDAAGQPPAVVVSDGQNEQAVTVFRHPGCMGASFQASPQLTLLPYSRGGQSSVGDVGSVALPRNAVISVVNGTGTSQELSSGSLDALCIDLPPEMRGVAALRSLEPARTASLATDRSWQQLSVRPTRTPVVVDLSWGATCADVRLQLSHSQSVGPMNDFGSLMLPPSGRVRLLSASPERGGTLVQEYVNEAAVPQCFSWPDEGATYVQGRHLRAAGCRVDGCFTTLAGQAGVRRRLRQSGICPTAGRPATSVRHLLPAPLDEQ
eukprot:PLAT3287.17.p1 GENE.PLAT3287.17~~PLAT3287.17.p1  ORF type:complete len:2228 (-),score=645.41 PLAT3287.17:2329-9012(-)